MDKVIAKNGATTAKIEGEFLYLIQLAKRCLQHKRGAILFPVPFNQPQIIPQTVIDNLVCRKGHAKWQVLIPDAMQGSFLLQETRNLKNVTVGKNEGFAGRKCDEFFVSDIVDDFF